MKESNHCQPLTSALVAFKKWAEICVVAPPENRQELPAEGLVLATARGKAMATLTRQDPQAAIQELLPYPLRKTLPLEISARIEHRCPAAWSILPTGPLMGLLRVVADDCAFLSAVEGLDGDVDVEAPRQA